MFLTFTATDIHKMCIFVNHKDQYNIIPAPAPAARAPCRWRTRGDRGEPSETDKEIGGDGRRESSREGEGPGEPPERGQSIQAEILLQGEIYWRHTTLALAQWGTRFVPCLSSQIN